MKGNIFILNEQEQLFEMREVAYESEDLLQKLLDNYPNLLGGDQINPENTLRWLPVSREMGVPAEIGGGNQWYLDHLFIDNHCIPTLIEVKRSTDTRIRREVVGQMLDYAANATKYWSIEAIIAAVQRRCQERNQSSLDYFHEMLGAEADYDLDTFWQQVDENLKTGRIRMLFVADSIPAELQSIIEFLNDQMAKSEVLGIEVRQYTNGKIKTLVPRVIGLTSKGLEKVAQNSPGKWDEVSFMEAVKAKSEPGAVEVYQDMLRRFERLASYVWWGNGKKWGSFVPVYEGKQNHLLFAMWTYGTIELYFQHYKAPFDSLELKTQLKLKLEDALGIQIPEDKLNKRPGYSWDFLKTQQAREALEKIFAWYINEIVEYENR